ncbi:MAG: hypothetical protein PHU98_06145 [Mariniphaga sp.]|nr:hypothetical protein [Paludibacter sp.]MDD4225951.1 hypothetical protein [Mariniphaga sp.]
MAESQNIETVLTVNVDNLRKGNQEAIDSFSKVQDAAKKTETATKQVFTSPANADKYKVTYTDLQKEIQELNEKLLNEIALKKESAKATAQLLNAKQKEKEAIEKTAASYKTAGVEMQKTTSLTDQMKKGFAALGITIGAAMAVRSIVNFGKESVKAFAEAEQGLQKLKFAVITVGGGTNSDLEKLQNQAKSLMGVFEDESIIDAQIKMLNFGLTVNQVTDIMPNLVDASAQSGKSLEEMAAAVNKGVDSGVMARSGLGQLGLAFKDTGSKAENFRIIQQGLIKFTGGAAEATETLAGKMKVLGVTMGEIKEAIGQNMAKSISPTIDALQGVAGFIDEAFSESKLFPIEKQRQKFLLLADAIQQPNITQERRNKLIEDAQKIYPSFLAGLETNQLTEAQINTAIREGNVYFDRRIELMRAEVRQQQADLTLKERYIEIENMRENIAERNTEAQRLLSKSTQENTLDMYNFGITALDSLFGIANSEVWPEITGAYDNIQKGIINYKEALQKAAENQRIFNERLRELVEGKISEKTMEAYYRMGRSLLISNDEIDKFIKKQKELAAGQEEISKNEEKKSKKEKEAKKEKLTLLGELEAEETALIKQRENQLLPGMEAELKKTSERIEQVRKLIKEYKQIILLAEKAAQSVSGEFSEGMAKYFDNIKKQEDKYINSIFETPLSKRIEKLSDKIRKDMEKSKTMWSGEQINSWLAAKLGIDEKGIKAIEQATLKTIESIADELFSIREERIERELALTIKGLEKEENAELEALRKKKEKGLITEEVYNKKELEIQKNFAAKKNAEDKKAFENTKKMKQAELWINYAAAVVGFYAGNTYPGGWIVATALAGLLAIEAGIQSANIANQEYVPQYEKGGLIEGKSHKQGGKMINVEGGEYHAIFNKKIMASKEKLQLSGTPLEIASTLNSWGNSGDPFIFNGSTIKQNKAFMDGLKLGFDTIEMKNFVSEKSGKQEISLKEIPEIKKIYQQMKKDGKTIIYENGRRVEKQGSYTRIINN